MLQYGDLLAPIAASQVDTPAEGVKAFININTLTLWGKFPDGSVKELSGSGSNSLLAPQASDEGTTGNTLIFNVTGVVAYNVGDTYYFMLPNANTGAVTININGLGAVPVYYKGNILAPIPAGLFQANTVHVFIYTGAAFQWAGKVDGGMVRMGYDVSYTEARPIGLATATANLDLINLPAKAFPTMATLRPTATAAAAGLSAATIQMTNIESGLDLFGGTIDNFVAPAADKGGISNGLKSNSDIPFQAGVQQYRAAWVLTGDIWNNVQAGAFRLEFAWTPLR